MMSHENSLRENVAAMVVALVVVLAASALCPPQAWAQVPPRFYWKTLSGVNAIPVIVNSISGNTNPFDPAHIVEPGANIDATVVLGGYAHFFTLFDRSAMAAVLLEMGRIEGTVTTDSQSVTQSARGFGDPMMELDVNLIGPSAQKDLVAPLRYEPGFSLDVIVDLTVPIGEYDSSRSLNLGQNRWSGRLGAPIVWQLGPWVPGRRTTLELLPAVWFFGTNNDFVGKTMTTDPIFQVDAHLTRDLTDRLWTSLDGAWYTGGQASIDGVEGEKLDNLAVGLTLGYQLNDSLALTIGYKSTINDSALGDLQMDGFMISLVSGWHPIIEGVRRLKGGE
jgi:Putative MetA-pathway of phenol degradation